MTGFGPGPGPQPGAYPGPQPGGYERDPFAYDPFAGPPGAPVPTPGPQGSEPAPVLPVLSTLFAFLCAPVGALLGHIALTQDSQNTDVRGRNLALVGVTLSYVFIVVALVVWGVAEAMY